MLLKTPSSDFALADPVDVRYFHCEGSFAFPSPSLPLHPFPPLSMCDTAAIIIPFDVGSEVIRRMLDLHGVSLALRSPR